MSVEHFCISTTMNAFDLHFVEGLSEVNTSSQFPVV